jgi:tRNA pseudouridine38-40 synthase
MVFKRNIKLIVEYDGSGYFGWQKQKQHKTVGGTLEEKLNLICSEKIKLISAGRTDSGVHGLGQVVNFKTKSKLAPQNIKKALNELLPKDILIVEAEEVDSDFHARFSAVSRTYQYLIWNSEDYSPFNRNYMWWVKGEVNLKKIKKALKYFKGEHDFTYFSANLKGIKNFKREIKEITLKKEKKILKFLVTANAFLPRMVRGIVGSLINLGKGNISLEDIKMMIEKKKRLENMIFAPANGLYLLKIEY